ncbi:flippase [Desulfosporosinus sp. OT]|uniref:flippase n=1 Tax=Desulfosporosinus sp. OT TaxID=913865 RepID=UPI001300C305|nr:flippase [Desulfosporosinus sp. OT]
MIKIIREILGNKLRCEINLKIGSKIIANFFLQACSIGFSLITAIILARTLGVAEYGTYAYVMAIISILVVPTTLGLPNLIIRLFAGYRVNSEWSLMNGLLRRTNQLVIIISIVMIAFSGLACWRLIVTKSSLFYTFLIALILLPVFALNSIRSAVLTGLNKTVISQIPGSFVQPFTFILFISLFYFLGFNLNSSWAMVFQDIASIVSLIVGTFMLVRHLPSQFKASQPKYDTLKWTKSALPLFIVGGMMLINNRIDIIMLGIMKGATEVGIYQVVTRGAQLVSIPLLVVSVVISPIFSELYVKKRMEQLQNIVTRSAQAIAILSFPFFIVFVLFGASILYRVFGSNYVAGSTALAILSFGQYCNAFAGSVGMLLNMTGHEVDSAKGVTIAAITNIILNLILIPKWSITGAAIATSISMILWNVILSIWVYKRIKIIPTSLGNIGTIFTKDS